MDGLEKLDDAGQGQALLLPEKWRRQSFYGMCVRRQLGHLEADDVSLFVGDEGLWTKDTGGEALCQTAVAHVGEFGGVLCLGSVVEFNGRIVSQRKYHPFAPRLDQLGSVKGMALFVEVNGLLTHDSSSIPVHRSRFMPPNGNCAVIFKTAGCACLHIEPALQLQTAARFT